MAQGSQSRTPSAGRTPDQRQCQARPRQPISDDLTRPGHICQKHHCQAGRSGQYYDCMARNFDHSVWEATAEYSSRAAAQIVDTGVFAGQAYVPIPLSSSEAQLVDISDMEQCDPNMLMRTDITTLYWGSAGHPLNPCSKSQMILG